MGITAEPDARRQRPGATDEPGDTSAHDERLAVRLLPFLWYALLATAVLWPLRRGGFVFLLDWAPAPTIEIVTEGPFSVHDAPALAVLKLAAAVVPVWVLQRVILFGAFVTAGIAMHRVVPASTLAARMFAGTLYAINPFTMARLGAGHWRILVAYALTPFAARAILRIFDHPSHSRAVVAGAWIAGIAAVSAHAVIIGLLVAACCVVVVIARRGSRVLLSFATTIVVVVVGVGWWAIPAARQGAPVGGGIESVSTFATTSVDGMSVPVTALALRGFWVERLDADGPAGWPILALVIVALAFAGAAIAVLRGDGARSLAIVVTAAAALIIAIGVSSSVTEPAARALYRNVPGWVLFREPHKALALVALAYAWLGAVAVDRLWRARRPGRFLALVAVVLPLVAGAQIFDGAGGRVRPSSYPASWRQAEAIMRGAPGGGRLLILPWQQYLHVPFARATIANPAPDFFSMPSISSVDPQLGPGPSPHVDPVRRRLDALVANPPERFGGAVAPLDVRFIAFIPGSPGYDRILTSPDLEAVLVAPDLHLYRNEAF